MRKSVDRDGSKNFEFFFNIFKLHFSCLCGFRTPLEVEDGCGKWCLHSHEVILFQDLSPKVRRYYIFGN
mgnify:CR=1 FL=1